MKALYNVLHRLDSIIYKRGLSYLLGMILLTMPIFFTMMSAQAAPCFDDPKQAYSYLIAQEKTETQARDEAVININTATEGELVSLNGIGSSKAQEIILYREMFGDFKSVDELEKVKGIGAKTIEKNRSRMRVNN